MQDSHGLLLHYLIPLKYSCFYWVEKTSKSKQATVMIGIWLSYEMTHQTNFHIVLKHCRSYIVRNMIISIIQKATLICCNVTKMDKLFFCHFCSPLEIFPLFRKWPPLWCISFNGYCDWSTYIVLLVGGMNHNFRWKCFKENLFSKINFVWYKCTRNCWS